MNFRNAIIAIFCFIAGALCAGNEPALIYLPGFREIHDPRNALHQNFILQNKYPTACNNKPIFQISFAVINPNDTNMSDYDSGLYTTHAVHHTARAFKNDAFNVEGVIGYSNGAGVLINFLEKLVNYDQNYWKQPSTKQQPTAHVTSPEPVLTKNDAKTIFDKINSSFLILDAPLVHVRNYNLISHLSSRISMGIPTIGAPLAALCCMPFSWSLLAASAAVGAVIGLVFKTPLERCIGNIIARNYVHKGSETAHFDPNHLSPLESAQRLKGKITCPVLIHFHENDGILDNPGADAALFCSAFDENRTVICVTRDGNHGKPSKKFEAILKQFLEKTKEKNVSWSKWISCEQDPAIPRCLYSPSEFKAKYGSIFD